MIKRKLNRVVEIFPKQIKLRSNDFGSWINLPYYNGDKTKQYLLLHDRQLNLDEALVHIKQLRISLTDATKLINDLPYQDAPPCLQTLYFLNNLSKHSGRNDYLFSFGVYFKRKDEDFFEQKLAAVNTNMPAPLSSDELERTILSSLRKKDYIYKCQTSPCVDFCNKNICKEREFGVGKEGGYFSELTYGKMFQIKTHQPYYEWEVKVEEKEIESKSSEK